jgi:hypothetical protein
LNQGCLQPGCAHARAPAQQEKDRPQCPQRLFKILDPTAVSFSRAGVTGDRLEKKPVGGLASGIQLLRFRYIHGFWNTGVVLSHPSRKVASSSFFDFAQNDKREPALSGVEGVGTQFYQDA